MALYPEVQRRAQVELDSVVGIGRFPEFSDKPNLPYINAIVTELLRWQPVLPLGTLVPMFICAGYGSSSC